MAIEIPRPESGDVVDLILRDHRLLEELLRELRNAQSDRDALRHQLRCRVVVAYRHRIVHPAQQRLVRLDTPDAPCHVQAQHRPGTRSSRYNTV